MSSDNTAVFNAAGSSAPQHAPDQHVKSAFDSIPQELITLPSKGVLYPRDSALHGQDGVEIRCMTAREEDLMTSSALIKQNLVLQKLMQACLVNKSIDVDSLLVGDRNAILTGIRVLSYGAEYQQRVTCPHCDALYDTEFLLNRLAIKPLGAKPIEDGQNLFQFTLPTSKQSVLFRLMTVADSTELAVIEERKRKAKLPTDNRLTAPVIQTVVQISDERDKGKLANMIQNMRAGDARALRTYMAKIAPDIDMKQESTCTACGESGEVIVPLGPSFFYPDI